jgi:potassium-dependent mechanosensitive channel
MSLIKLTAYCLALCFSLVGLPVNAQPIANQNSGEAQAEESAITVTPEWLEERQKVVTQAQAKLEKAQAAMPAEEQALREKIARLETTDKITQKMLDKAAAERQAANQKVEEFRLERQRVQTELEPLRKRLTEIQTTFKELTKFPREEQTVAQNQRISEVENEVALQDKAVKLAEQHLNIIKAQAEIAIKRTIFAINWHSQLQTVPQQRRLKEREQAMAEAQAGLEQTQKNLETEQKELPNKITSLEAAQLPVEKLTERLKKALLDKEAADVDLQTLVLESKSAETNLERERNTVNDGQIKLETLRKTPPAEPEQEKLQERRVLELESQVNLQQKTFELDKQQLEMLKKRIEQAKKRLALATEWHDKLQAVHKLRKQQELEAQIQKERQRHLARAAELRWDLDKLPISEENAAQRELLKVQIREANELAEQVERRLKIQHIEEQLHLGQTAVEQETTEVFSQSQLDNTQSMIQETGVLLQETIALQKLLQSKIAVLEQQQELTEKRGSQLTGKSLKYNNKTKKLLAKLQKSLQQELDKMPALLAQTEELQKQLETAYKDSLRRALIRQRQLPASTAEWQTLLGEISTIPNLLLQQLLLTGRGFIQAFQQTQAQRWIVISIVLLIWLILAKGMRAWFTRIINTLSSQEERSRLVNHLLLGLSLLRMNTGSIAVTGVVLLLLWLTQPTQLTFTVTLILLLIWLGTQLLISLSWLLLSELQPPRTKLSLQLRGVIIVLGLLTVITALVHVESEEYALRLSLTARDLIDTVFMLLLALLVLPLMRIRKIMLSALSESVQGYWLLVISLVTLLVPLGILAVSILGLIGYISLGWTVAENLSLFLLVLTGWLIARGLLADFINGLKNLALKHSSYGSLWAEDIIPLVDKVLGFTLIVLAVIAFLWLSGWSSDVAIKQSLVQLYEFPLFKFPDGNAFTVGHVLLTIVLLWAVFWFGSWSRQVTYRWVLGNVADTGVRHSLSVFIQYAVVLIGLLIALKAIGFDPTALTVLAGAVGIGIGFGLQNIVNNFLSGILLLVERPLRSGDFVEIGSSSGTVTQIGMSSLTLITADRKEIRVPNADIISGPVTNMTRHSIIRTTLYVGISYEDDPHLAEEIIKSVLDDIPEVLNYNNPPDEWYEYQVILWEFTDFKVTFRINYFIDTTQAFLPVVKSKVLFKIWDRFKVVGITIPYPQQDVHLKSVSESNLPKDNFRAGFLKPRHE